MARTDTPIGKTEDIPVTGKEFAIVAPARKPGQYLGMAIDRTGWSDEAQRLKLALMASVDGGATWREWCSYVDHGGEQRGPKGELLLASAFMATPPADGALLSVIATAQGKTVKQPVAFVEVS